MQKLYLGILTLFVLAFNANCASQERFLKRVYNHNAKSIELAAPSSKGECPNSQYNNFGPVTSPNFPANYGNGDNCAYFLTAPVGLVVRLEFSMFSTEACCDFLYLYDGPSQLISPLIARLSGQSLAKTVYFASARWMALQFVSDPTINFPGFSANFSSVSTATPCNRDMIIAIDGHSTIGSQANFQAEVDFATNVLIANWTVGPTTVQVGPTLYMKDESITYFLNDAKSLPELQNYFRAFSSQSIAGQTLDSMQIAFELVTSNIDVGDVIKEGWRLGVQRVLVMFISFPPNDDADVQAAKVFTDKILSQGTTIVLVGLNSNVNVNQLIPLSSGPNFVIGVNNVSQLNAAVAARINAAICTTAS